MTASQIATAKMADLVAFYNKTTGKNIKKFETIAIARSRCAALASSEKAAPAPMRKAPAVRKPAPAPLAQVAATLSQPAARSAPSKAPAAQPDGGDPQFRVADDKMIKRGVIREFVDLALKQGTFTRAGLVKLAGKLDTDAHLRRHFYFCVRVGCFAEA